MHCQEPADDLALWRLEQTHPSRQRARRIQVTAFGLAALIGTATTVGAIVAGVAVFESSRTADREVVATTAAEAHVRPRDLPGDRVRWAAPVTWTDSSGAVHRGTVDVAYQLPAGAPVPVGLASDGSLRKQPVPIGEAALRGFLTVTVIGAAGALVVRGIVPSARRRAEDARIHSWERSWADLNRRPRALDA